MKTKKIQIFILSIVILSLIGSQACRKDKRQMDAYFYTSTVPADGGNLSFYLDNQFVGILPYFSGTPACGDVACLHHTISTGKKHSLVAKNAEGVTVSDCYFKYGKTIFGGEKMSSGGKQGGSSSMMTGDNQCVLIDIFK